jgi:hypothetical protein
MQQQPSVTTPPQRVMDLAIGTWVSQAMSVAASLGVADQLAAGPRGIDEIAEAVGADAPSLYRVLRALAGVEVFQELDGRRFALTELGDLLRTDAAGTMRYWSMLVGLPPWRDMWTDLLATVRTGEPAFHRVHGQGPFEYLRAHPEYAEVFDAAMTAISRQWVAAIVESYDFSGFGTVVDVGGGNGALLATVLAANPKTRGVLFDVPAAVAGAERLLAEAGVGDRCACVGGDFFDTVPAGGDAYLLSNIIHDWDDERSVRILTNCRTAMAPAGRVLLGEAVLPDEPQPSVAHWADLEMLLVGGRQRTAAEFARLFDRAGLQFSRVVPAGAFSAVEAVPRP